jgi:hypothetical protein
LELAGKKCATLLDERVKNVCADNVEVDDLYSYIITRPENTPRADPIHGEMFCFLGIVRESKLVVSHLIGKRVARNCSALLADIKSRLAERPQV